ncbi:MAG: hypothetical protein ACXAAP_09375 [Candidatus Thorarchaeota archaeon]|jgi:hypothetical protein
MRITKSLLVVGIILCLVAFFPDEIVHNGDYMNGGPNYGHVVQTTGSIYLEVTAEGEDSFDVFVVTYDDAIRAFEEESLENASILLELEDVEQYQGIIDLSAGTYVVFITPSNTTAEDARFFLIVYRVTPHLRVLALALIVIIIAVIPVVFRVLRQRTNYGGS